MSDWQYKRAHSMILFGLGVYLLYKVVSGTLYFYINARFTWLVVLGGVGLLLLGFVAWPRGSTAAASHSHAHDHTPRSTRWALLVLGAPLLLGFLVPARPLDGSALDTRGLTTRALMSVGGQNTIQLDQPSDQRSVLDWVRAFNYASDPQTYVGEQADVVGFVYQDERLPAGQFLVGRFAVSCCVADAFAVGVIVQSSDAAQWAANQWVHVAGTVAVGSLEGVAIPLIEATSIKAVPIPPQPYLFP